MTINQQNPKIVLKLEYTGKPIKENYILNNESILMLLSIMKILKQAKNILGFEHNDIKASNICEKCIYIDKEIYPSLYKKEKECIYSLIDFEYSTINDDAKNDIIEKDLGHIKILLTHYKLVDIIMNIKEKNDFIKYRELIELLEKELI